MKFGKLIYQLKKYLYSFQNLHLASTLPEMECMKKIGFLILLSTVMRSYFLSPFTLVQDFYKLTGIILSFLIGLYSLLTWKRLFNMYMINEVATTFEAVTGSSRKKQKQRENPQQKIKMRDLDGKSSNTIQAMEKKDEHGDTLSGACGDNYASAF
ncbi:unnamed protein product [Eruca vesicaria subsp. sativa]|uniref:Uncharacterized protein n=1 Tax=Eruca vesicaria subsp. sativa TaxID=29727 RepID=A0ABC8L3H5_ERUVS|nr:unnamed protein product [Eruca vesicaria subsp. sativa]